MKLVDIDLVTPEMQSSRKVLDSGGNIILATTQYVSSEKVIALKNSGIGQIAIVDPNNIVESSLNSELAGEVASLRKETVSQAAQFIKAIKGNTALNEEARHIVLRHIETAVKLTKVAVILAGVRALDNYLFAHSVNTAVTALLIARLLDTNPQNLDRICLSALLSDAGMALVPPSSWQHAGKLTEDQRNEIKRHVSHIDNLPVDGIIDKETLFAINQHHERFDGTGYPLGLRKDEI